MTEDQELNALRKHTAELVEQFEMTVAERVNEAMETVIETVYNALSDELIEAIDGYLSNEVGEAVNELSEAVEGVEAMVVSLADCGDDETRKKFYARVAKAAQQQPRPEQGEYPGANQDGSAVVGDDTAARNRQNLKRYSQGEKLVEGVVDDNNALKDEMEAREKARKDLFHSRLMEYVEGKDRHPTNQGVLSRPGVISED